MLTARVSRFRSSCNIATVGTDVVNHWPQIIYGKLPRPAHDYIGEGIIYE